MVSPRSGATSTTSDDEATPRTSRLRRRVEVSWVVTIVLFTLVRLAVAAETLRDYGLNIWVFGIIDLATAVPYAVGIAKVVESFIDHRPRSASTWGIVACASFLAPYLYILWVGKDVEFPTIVYVVLFLLIGIFGANAIRGITLKVRAASRAHHPSIGPTDPIEVP